MDDYPGSPCVERIGEELNLDEICRLCRTSRGVMSYIFSCTGVDTSTPLSERIMAFANIKVSEDDGLPSLICHRCLYHIEKVNEFKLLCLQSDSLLRQYLSLQGQVKVGETNSKNNETQTSEDHDIHSYMSSIELQAKEESINQHIKLERSNETYVSNECGDNLSEEDLKLSCLFCYKRFFTTEQRNRHILIHSQEGPFPCDYCDVVERDKVSLRAHWKEAHSDDRKLMCQTCGESFSTKIDLVYHKFIHERAKPHQCGVCSKSYVYRSDLRKHMLLHSEERPFMCDVCCKSFTRYSSLNRHRRQHDGTEPFPCMDCDKIFGSRDDLRRHSSTHTGDRPYSCVICNISFNRRDKLVRHEKIHVMDRPHPCPRCPTSFSRKEELTKHMQFYHYSNLVGIEIDKSGATNATEDVVISIDPTHWAEHESSDSIRSIVSGHPLLPQSNTFQEKVDDGRIFGCDYCVKRFKTKRELVRHISVHTGYRPHICHICDKAFSRMDKLKRHILTHSKAKKPGRPRGPVKHECTACSKVFSSKSDLRRHQLLHAAFRPYSCAHCTSSYCNRGNLVNHIKRNHLPALLRASSQATPTFLLH